MNLHTGRSEIDSIIDSLPDDDHTHKIVRDAVEKWGPDLLMPFQYVPRKRLTRPGLTPTMRVRSVTQSHNLSDGGNVADMLSSAFAPTSIGGIWAAQPDVPDIFAQSVASYSMHFRAPGTLRRHWTCWKKCCKLCLEADVCPLPMTVGTACGIVAAVADSGVTFGDVQAVRQAIAFVHKYHDLPDPTKDFRFQAVFGGIRRELGTRVRNPKLALTRAEVGSMIGVAYRRRRPDHAVALAVAFEGALRNGELCALKVDDVEHTRDGVRLYIRRSKTDQSGNGAHVDLRVLDDAPFDAGVMVMSWVERLGRKKGFLFSPLRRHGVIKEPLDERTFTRMVKFYAAAIGLDPTEVASHSMRAGYITTEIDLERPPHQIAAHARHSSVDMLLRYYRPRRRPTNFVAFASAGSL